MMVDGFRLAQLDATRAHAMRWPEYRLGVDRTPATARYLNQG